MFYSETGSCDPYYNLAYEEYILKNKTEGDWLLLWQNENTVVVGLNQNTIEEIDPAFIAEHRVNVVRRSTGSAPRCAAAAMSVQQSRRCSVPSTSASSSVR